MRSKKTALCMRCVTVCKFFPVIIFEMVLRKSKVTESAPNALVRKDLYNRMILRFWLRYA
jgi:hypothetical protein